MLFQHTTTNSVQSNMTESHTSNYYLVLHTHTQGTTSCAQMCMFNLDVMAVEDSWSCQDSRRLHRHMYCIYSD